VGTNMQFEWPSLPSVRSISTCTPKNIDGSILTSSEPLILKGFGDSWPFVQAGKISAEASLGYMQKYYSGVPITTCYGEPETEGRIFYNEEMTGFNFKATRQPFENIAAEFLKQSANENPPTLYIPSTDINHWFPDIDKENNAGLDHLSPIKFVWAGNRTRIAAHYDFPSNIACCITGRRRFTLFPPEQVANLYPGPLEFAPGGQEISLVDFAAPDFKKFPKFEQAIKAAQVAELNPGDALFLPGMWWHHVEGLDPINILYTHWWKEPPLYLGRPTNALLHAVMSLRNLPANQRKAWQSLFNYYVFDREEKDIENIVHNARGMLNLPITETDVKKLRADLAKRLNN